MSPCYRTLQLGTDEWGGPLVTLSNLSNWNGMCIHVSVTDVIHKTFPALIGRKCLCSGSRLSISRAVTVSGYFQPVQTCRYQSIRKIFLGLPAVVWVLPSHGTHYAVRYRLGGRIHLVTELIFPIIITFCRPCLDAQRIQGIPPR